ncbi:MAG: tetratricopeptide repeat protein [Burkholderiales bacterium]|nr:tetratricopeptide repeat protein [Burkholderiales bacterium]
MNAVLPPARFPTWRDQHYLLIDDTQGMRQLLRESLRGLGARYVDQASSGGEAIAMLAQTRYDVVLCDYHLGKGKNGQQVLEEAKFRELILPTTVWMMVSAEKTTEVVMGTAELHPDAYLLKPITEGVLLSRLHKVWNKKQVFRPIDHAYQQRDFLKAATLCDHQIEHNREHALNLLRMKADLLLKCGRQEEAKEVYERVLATKNFSWAVAGIAKIRLQNGEPEAARHMLTEVINGNRFFMEAYDHLAQAYQTMGQFEEAAAVLERAANLSPNSVVRQRSLGELCLKLGKMATAEKAFRKCLALGEHSVMKNADAYLGLARVCGIKNETEEAMALLTQVQREFSHEHIRLRSKITEGMVHHESGDYLRARKSGDELDSMLRLTPSRPPAAICLDMARLLLAVGVKEASVDLLTELARNNHDNTQLLAEIKQVFEKAKMAAEGNNIISQSCDEAADMMNRGVLLWKTGRLQEAVNWMRTTVKALPNNQRVLFNCAQIIINCIEKHGYDAALAEEARTALLHVEQLNPGQPRFASMMATLNEMAQIHRAMQNA